MEQQHVSDTVEDAKNTASLEDGVFPADELVDATDAVPVAANGLASPPVPASSRLRHVLRGAVRALFVLSLSQYIITTIIVILAALAISHEASGILIDKFDALARTIRRF